MSPIFARAVTANSTKTPEQLKREIAYFAGVLLRTTSTDRRRRAHIAIQVREAALTLAIAIKVRAGRVGPTTRGDQA
jgi:hypothetical protein